MQILQSISNLKNITASVKSGAEEMSHSGDEVIEEINEFIKISNQVVTGMNGIISGAMNEIQIAVKHVDEMNAENSNNFTALRQEADKFKVSTSDEKKKILVVDDDTTHLTATRGMLEGGYEVVTAKSGHDALILFFQGLVPNLILLDLVMPDMDGWDAFDRIKALSTIHDVPIAFFTSSDDPEDMTRAQHMGAVDFIKKPTKKSELLSIIERIIDN